MENRRSLLRAIYFHEMMARLHSKLAVDMQMQPAAAWRRMAYRHKKLARLYEAHAVKLKQS